MISPFLVLVTWVHFSALNRYIPIKYCLCVAHSATLLPRLSYDRLSTLGPKEHDMQVRLGTKFEVQQFFQQLLFNEGYINITELISGQCILTDLGRQVKRAGGHFAFKRNEKRARHGRFFATYILPSLSLVVALSAIVTTCNLSKKTPPPPIVITPPVNIYLDSNLVKRRVDTIRINIPIRQVVSPKNKPYVKR